MNPGRAAAPGLGSEGGAEIAGQAELNPEDTPRCPGPCLTCEGVVRWTEERRQEAASYAASHGRRIIDLPELGMRAAGPLDDVPTPFHRDWEVAR